LETKNNKISIIVAIYNVEAFLRKCIKSILSQTYTNIELILVDDGSPDNSGEICDDFAEEDDRIVVVHQENGGVCSARNAGLAVATGEWVGFVDPDDWIDPNMYQYLLDSAIMHGVDIAACAYYRVEKNKHKVISSWETYIYDSHSAIEDMVNDHMKMRVVPWNKLFKRKLFNDLQFPVGRIYEGNYIMHNVFGLANKILYMPEPKYYYRKNPNSLTHLLSLKNDIEWVAAHIKRYEDLHKKHPHLVNKLMAFIVVQSVNLVYTCYKQRQEIKNYMPQIKEVGDFVNDNWDYIEKMSRTNRITMQKLKYLTNPTLSQLYFANILRYCGKKRTHIKKRMKKMEKRLKTNIRATFFPKKTKLPSYRVNISELTTADNAIFSNIRKVMLELLDEVVRICDRHNLTYFLYGGTLLGAIRHEGFIPWDDDIDIAMPRDDFEKFEKICETELSIKYFYQTSFTDSEYSYPNAKLRKNFTFAKQAESNIHQGIFIGIFALTNFPNTQKKKILKQYSWILDICERTNINSLLPHKQLLHKFYRLMPSKARYDKRQIFLQKVHKCASDYVCSFGSGYLPLEKRVFEKAWFAGYEYSNFEGKQYKIPTGWKEYLIHVYGPNYMKLPPEHKRKSHFNFYNVRFETDDERGRV